MEQRKAVIREILTVCIGEVVGVCLMFGVYALIGRFTLQVLLGGVIGMLVSCGNFFFLAVSASVAADKAEAQNVKGGTVLMRSSYLIRLAVMFIVLFVAYKSGRCELFSLLIPLLFTRPTLLVAEFFRKAGDKG